MSAVVPLDPASPHGRAIAARWSRTLALIEREITARSKPPKQGTPAPSPAPKPKPAPSGPTSPAKSTGRAA